MKAGDIVYHNNLFFPDHVRDNKKNRPCVFLYKLGAAENTLVCSCTITSQVNTFNKHPDKHWLISIPIYNENKLSFAQLDGIVFNSEDETHYTGVSLDRETTHRLMEKILSCISCKSDLTNYKYTQKILEYTLLFDDLEAKEQARQKKIEKKEKRGKGLI